MAREFEADNSEYLELDSAPVAAEPLTMACWFVSNDVTTARTLMSIQDKDSDTHFWQLLARGNATGDPVVLAYCAGGAISRANTSTAYSAATWHHACGIAAASNSHTVYIDGGSAGTNTTDAAPANVDRVSIGRHGIATAAAYADGLIAEAAIWNVALSAGDVAMLALGTSPLQVKATNLVAYWPLIQGDQDWVGGFNLTAYNTPTVGVHPPKIRPWRRRRWTFIPAVAPAGVGFWPLLHRMTGGLVE